MGTVEWLACNRGFRSTDQILIGDTEEEEKITFTLSVRGALRTLN